MIAGRSGLRLGGEVDRRQPQQQNSAFDPRRPDVQSVELHANRIVDRHGTNFANRSPQRVHARNDAELRNRRQDQHQKHEHVPRRQYAHGARAPAGYKAWKQPGRGRRIRFPSNAVSPASGEQPARPNGAVGSTENAVPATTGKNMSPPTQTTKHSNMRNRRTDMARHYAVEGMKASGCAGKIPEL